MNHGSLFSGIGGFDLAADWMGWDNIFHCEKNDFGKRVLKHYWPKAYSYDDITTTDFTIHRGTIDILTGGFPCQPYSTAGKRLGKEDERHLWPHMLRAIREISPRWVVGENVRGLTNWNAGLVFDEVQANLETEGYEVLPFLLPAAGVNAPHRRDRIWFIAYSRRNGDKCMQHRKNQCSEIESKSIIEERERLRTVVSGVVTTGLTSHPDNTGIQGGAASRHFETVGENTKQFTFRHDKPSYWGDFPTQSPFIAEMMGFPVDWTVLPFQNSEQNP